MKRHPLMMKKITFLSFICAFELSCLFSSWARGPFYASWGSPVLAVGAFTALALPIITKNMEPPIRIPFSYPFFEVEPTSLPQPAPSSPQVIVVYVPIPNAPSNQTPSLSTPFLPSPSSLSMLSPKRSSAFS